MVEIVTWNDIQYQAAEQCVQRTACGVGILAQFANVRAIMAL